MKKRLIHILLFLVLIISSIGVSFASFSQLVNEKDFTSSGVKDDTNSAVCYSTNTQKYYTSIEKGINETTNGTLYVLPGTTYTIKDSFVIKENATLCLPYSLDISTTSVSANYINNYDSGENNANTKFADESASNVSKYRVTQLILDEEKTITNNGNLIIGGNFGSTKGNILGHVSDLYCEITLKSNSKIISNNNMEIYGYIKEYNETLEEQLKGNDSSIEIYSGKVKIPFVFYDFNSVSVTSNYIDCGVFPFEHFDMPNIQTRANIYYGSVIVGIFRATLSILNMSITEEVNIVGHDTTSGLLMINSGYISIKYTSHILNYTNGDIEAEKHANTLISIFGDVDINYIYLNVQNQIKIDTRVVPFPFTYRFNIEVQSGTLSFNYKVKFMNGSYLKVYKDSTLELNDAIIFYPSSFIDDRSKYYYPRGLDNAKLVLNGKLVLNSNGKIGGFIENEISTYDNTLNGLLDFTNISESQMKVTFNDGNNGTMEIMQYANGYVKSNTNETDTYQIYSFNYGYVYIPNEGKYLGHKLTSHEVNIEVDGLENENYDVTFSISIADSENGLNEVNYVSGLKGNYNLVVEQGKYVKINLELGSGVYFANDLVNDISNSYFFVNEDLNIIVKAIQIITCVFGFQGTGVNHTGINFDVLISQTPNGTYTEMLSDCTSSSQSVNLPYGIYFKLVYNSSWTSGKTASYIVPEGCLYSGNSSKHQNSNIYCAVDVIEITVNQNYCIVEGTKILMANGEQKAVENLKVGDEVKVFNHMTGKIDTSFIAVNVHENQERVESKIINLVFSNGVKTRISYEHGFFDKVLNEYVYINESNYKEMIGRKFIYVYKDKVETVTLINAYATYETVYLFSPFSYKNLNIISDGLLSIGGDAWGIFNYFELDENMKVIEEKMLADIETYGLFTYEEWAEYLTPIEFEAFNVKYLKVSIGKGLVTMEELLRYINSYLR